MTPQADAELAALVEALQTSLVEVRARSARFEQALAEALEQQAATGEVLRAVSRSPELQPVLDAVARSAARLCASLDAAIYRPEGDRLILVAHHGAIPLGPLGEFSLPLVRGVVAGRAVLEREAVQVANIQAEEGEFPQSAESGRRLGFRAILCVPLMREAAPIGVISLRRAEAEPFSERQVALLETFADQATIAVENARLLGELQAKNADLIESLEQQTATSEILRVISSSPTDLQPVLDAVAENAARLCGANDAQIFRVEDGSLSRVASHGPIPEVVGRPISRGWVTGRAVVDRRTIHVHDLATESDSEYPMVKGFQQQTGHRTTLATPLLREGVALGAILVRRMEVLPFSDKQVRLLETFADQAVIAIENARLFGELQARNRDLTEALEQQTATAEILRVISSSPTDIQPVLDTVAESAARLCEAQDAQIFRREEERLLLVAHHGPIASGQIGRSSLPFAGTANGRSVLEARTLHLADMQTEGEEYPAGSAAARKYGHRTTLITPLMREGVAIGTLGLRRNVVQPFTDRQVALLQTFADQAVIAIENVRLFTELEARNRDLTDALDRQTATAEILRAISQAQADVQPVFEVIADSSIRLLRAWAASVWSFQAENNLIRLAAARGGLPGSVGPFLEQRGVPHPPRDGSLSGRTVLTRTVQHVVDADTDPSWSARFHDEAKARGFRSAVAVPMLRGGVAVGVVAVTRESAGGFAPAEIALLQTFADQAVIAVENARLLGELQEKNATLTEALEQQTATSEILRAISRSPTDAQPVFDVIVESACRLCDGVFANAVRFDGDLLHNMAEHGFNPEAREVLGRVFPRRPGPDSMSGRAILASEIVESEDSSADDAAGLSQQLSRLLEARAQVAVPLLREGVATGAIVVARREAGRFPARQVELLKTFADQAVIAVENVRLFKELEARNGELRVALEQQTATSELLKVAGRSTFDLQPVFETLAEHAIRLCEAKRAVITRFDGRVLRVVAVQNVTAELRAFLEDNPIAPGRHSASARAALERRTVHILDVQTDPEYTLRAREIEPSRTTLAIPMLRAGELLGVILIFRHEVRAFTDGQVALMETFADQAAIAIENARLLNELQTKNADLTEALEQQTATSEILRVISSSPTDVQPVFTTIVRSAVQLSGARTGALYQFDGDLLHLVAHHDQPPEVLAALERAYPMVPTRAQVSGRAILDRAVAQIPDVRVDTEYAQDMAVQTQWRSLLAVPMIRADGTPMGVIVIQRLDPGEFATGHVELLKTFGDQAVIAIQNVRLFEQLDARNRELRVALEQQTATSELLKVIGRSTFDLQPVFETLAENAVRLCEAERAFIFRFDGRALRVVAAHNTSSELRAFIEAGPLEPGRGSGAGRAAQERRTVHIHDVQTEPEYTWGAREVDPMRTVLAIPMLRGGELLGVIGVNRHEVRPFGESQIALLETFADQAAIAIENARLLNELQAKNADLTEALEQQTATSEILRVISRSQTDTRPVFDTIVTNAVNLCRARMGAVFRFDGALVHLVAHHNYSAEVLGVLQRMYPRPPQADQVSGRAILTRTVAQIADMLEDPLYPREMTLAGGWRSIVGVPMLRDGEPIGVIVITRSEAGAFSSGHVDLLKTFADQAVIAVENVRLFTELAARNGELREALEQQTATSELLKVIGRSTFDLQPVFEMLADNAVRLCGAERALVFRFDGQLLRVVAIHNPTLEMKEFVERTPIAPGRHSGAARAALERRTIHIQDVQTDPEFTFPARQIDPSPIRTVLAIPMLRAGELLGVILIYRYEVRAFSDNQIAVLETFADQAAIAIENARLLTELQARTGELTRSVGELQALGEVSQALSSTLDLDTVLETIVSRANQLAGADGCSVWEYDEGTEEFHFRATDNLDEAVIEVSRRTPIRRGEGNMGRMAVTREPVQIPDIGQEGAYRGPLRDVLLRTGNRALLAVPLLREDHLIGGLTVNKKTPGEFAPEVIDLLKTFAAQSALAIQNARLFREIGDKSRQLELADRHKSEFLANMSHELRTPLNAIIGYSEMLQEDAADLGAEQFTEDLGRINAAGKHLLELINAVLDLSKIEAGKMELYLESFDVAGLVRDIAAVIQPLAAKNANRLEVRCPAETGTMRADLTKVRQALFNLLSNACKFTDRGTVRLEVAGEVAAGQDSMVFRVSDTGIGMSPEQLGAALRGLRPGRRGHHPTLRGNRSRPGAEPAALPDDGRRRHRRERGGAGQHLHHPAAGAGDRARRGAGGGGRAGPSRRAGHRHRAGHRRRGGGAGPDAAVPHAGRVPGRHRAGRRGGPAARPRAAARRDHARRHDARDGRLGGAVGAQGRRGRGRHPGDHVDHRRRQEPGLRARRFRLPDQADRSRAAGDGARAAPARPPGAGGGRRRRAPAAPPADARAGGLHGGGGGERARGARAPAGRPPERDPARPDDAGDGRLRVRRRVSPARGVARDPHRRRHRQGPVPRGPGAAQRPRAEDSPEGDARPRGAARRGARAGHGQRGPPEAPRLMAKILLVEDNEMNRDMLSRRLARRGYEVAIAVDGEQGVAMARSEAPALILMDMSLPGLDGWEATRRIKAAPETRAIPVIALTAHAMSGDREKAVAAGCDDFDTKPVDLARLLEKIEAQLGRASGA